MVATTDNSQFDSGSHGHSKRKNQKKGKNSGNRKNSGGSTSRGSGSGKSGQVSGGGSGGAPRGSGGQQPSPYWQPQFPPWGWMPQGWPVPPCPYPTQNWARPNYSPRQQPGILGPRPQQGQQAYTASSHGQPGSYAPSYAPTDIESAMHTMTLTQPNPAWYMDTGATSHMTSSPGNFSSYFNLSTHPNNGIVVGNGHTIPILGYGHTNLSFPTTPLALKNVLHAPKLIKNLISVRKFDCNKHSSSSICDSCVYGKHVKLPFAPSTSHTLMPFDIIHSDLWTSPILSSLGHRYYIVLLDDLSNYLWTFPIAKKSDVYETFLAFKAHIHTQFERSVKNIQCDNGREFDNGPFWEFCKRNGLSFRLSCPHTSSQNGKAERKIRTINNVTRTLLAHASLPPSFWHHALQIATYLLNIRPSKLLGNKSPLELLYQRVPSYSHLRVFGCLCYPLIPSTTINKLQPRSTPCVFLGFPSNHRGYKCFDLASNKTIICRHVLFDEHVFPFAKLHTPTSTSYDFLGDGLHPLVIHHLTQPAPQTRPNSSPSSPAAQPRTPQNSHTQHPSPTTAVPPLGSQEALGPPSPSSPQKASPLLSPLAQQQNGPPTPSSTHIQLHKPNIVTRSQNGNVKPNKKYFSNVVVTRSPLPRNPVADLRDPN
ncbi:uncharacterized protein LOC110707588 [Chenopodium quinoa]|uniref:uncharacterized protein LOC110707588 n=1 Tax=Chenopodium quinoa TaxID=63459 RepID=UPI000B78A2BE|nr:uncharacterized protein LOC110707588 [Chenopodium quinoa]